MKRAEKATVVDEIATQISESEAIYAADYRGISVSQVAQLRATLREVDASFRVVKNTLTLLAADKAGAENVKELVEGPTAFTFVQGDPAIAAKALDTFARRENVLELRGGVLDGELLDADTVKRLARLPSREQLVAQFAGVVASPLTGLARGLGALVSGLAIALGQVREQREAAGEKVPQPEPESKPEQPPAEESADEPAEAAEKSEAAAEDQSEGTAEQEEATAEQPEATEGQAEITQEQPEVAEEQAETPPESEPEAEANEKEAG
jgi:large subunit ribosomal protein L10